MRSRYFLWFIVIITLLSVLIDLPKLHIPSNLPFVNKVINPPLNQVTGKFPLKLGLDLQGGTQLVLQADVSKLPADQKDIALEAARSVIERRVNLFGVSEAVVQTSKLGEERRILVDLPSIDDASAAASLVGKTAQLDFREIPASRAAEATVSALAAYLYSTPTGMTGADLRKFEVVFGQGSASVGPQVALEFTGEGSKKFAEITKRNVGKQLPIFLDEEIILAPVVQQEIIGSTAVISGSFTPAEAKRITAQLNSGALPVPIKILQQRLIGASLGQEAVEKSVVAGLVGLTLVAIYMLLFYGFYGLIADIALIIYTILSIAIYKTGLFIMPPITLSLAGIAGFILSIGMAVDANILIFERMKEEKRAGSSAKTVLETGFKRAWSSIRDSNISSLITATILYSMGTGLIKGFAITFAIGVLLSMFTAISVTRTLLRLFIKK